MLRHVNGVVSKLVETTPERGFNGQGRTVFGIEGLGDFHITATKPYP